jgi:hypothetical protein
MNVMTDERATHSKKRIGCRIYSLAPTLRLRTVLCAAFLLVSQNAQANELVFGLGGSDLLDEVRKEAVAGLIEYHTDPFWNPLSADVSWLVALQIDTTDNIFLGVGVHGLSRLGTPNFFVEASISGGAFHQGNGIPTTTESFLFRSSIGAGFYLDDNSRVSLTIDHLLNSDFKNYDPGTEAILLRYTRGF